ncbi:MAG: biotin--[acetyl-CoA-carboxylase] ligase [Thermodesulfobacteriota bacterium]|nr:biotin--[acetyl-CoA-carboxylase] ligase [Thermodesulfobacteriota bacterium]
MDNPLCLTSTDSTNEDARQLALKGARHGFGVIADTQLAGKGRLGKDWVSPAQTGLYCSIVVRPQLPFTEFPKLTLTAGLALCSAVEILLPDIPFGLKWPNDLYSNTKKCGGILTESSSPNCLAEESFVVVGIGVNVNTPLAAFPLELQQKATSIRIQSGKVLDILELYHKIHDSLLDHVRIHETLGFEHILQEWRKRDILLGKEMQWVTRNKKVITACGMGPDANGQLLARDNSGRVHEILSGDVQLADTV